MKILKTGILSIACMFFIATSAIAAGKETVTIKTSAQCGMCKERIEGAIHKLDGVMKAELNVDTKALTVRFNSETVTADDIRKTVASLGYDADNVKADKEALAALPKCCQPKVSSCSKSSGKSCSKNCTKPCCAGKTKTCSKSGKTCSKNCTKSCCAGKKPAQ